MATSLTATGIQFPDDTVTSTNLLPSGTRLLFHNSTAPTGWTKDTSIDDSALRVVSGTPGSGGSTGFASALGTPSVSGSVGLSGAPGTGSLSTSISGDVGVGSTTLSVSQMPSHNHQFDITGRNESLGGSRIVGSDAQADQLQEKDSTATGGSGSHSHNATHDISGTITGNPSLGTLSAAISSASTSINVKYQDFIIAQKD
jgi:microcystin-dependent protein